MLRIPRVLAVGQASPVELVSCKARQVQYKLSGPVSPPCLCIACLFLFCPSKPHFPLFSRLLMSTEVCLNSRGRKQYGMHLVHLLAPSPAPGSSPSRSLCLPLLSAMDI